MLALALLLARCCWKDTGEWTLHRPAARACGMERQTLRDWVHRFNVEGIAGLSNRWGWRLQGKA